MECCMLICIQNCLNISDVKYMPASEIIFLGVHTLQVSFSPFVPGYSFQDSPPPSKQETCCSSLQYTEAFLLITKISALTTSCFLYSCFRITNLLCVGQDQIYIKCEQYIDGCTACCAVNSGTALLYPC